MDENDEYERATALGEKLRREGPVAIAARYDRRIGRVLVRLRSGLELAFSPRDVQGLEQASAKELSIIEISPSGLGLHFPAVDADIYIPGLMEGDLGSAAWMAARLGQRGGRATSAAKAAASRANGKRGGRPRKDAA
jgi:hypothetical protein